MEYDNSAAEYGNFSVEYDDSATEYSNSAMEYDNFSVEHDDSAAEYSNSAVEYDDSGKKSTDWRAAPAADETTIQASEP